MRSSWIRIERSPRRHRRHKVPALAFAQTGLTRTSSAASSAEMIDVEWAEDDNAWVEEGV
jgi:hypothetical protein